MSPYRNVHDEIEGVLAAWTTTRPHVQVGIARMLTLDLDDRVTR